MAATKTVSRVSVHTAPSINRRIRREMECRLRYYADHPQEIDERLRELDREWDIERTLEANAAGVGLSAFGLAVLAGRKFLLLPVAVFGFLLQHALHGWCPPVPVFRRLGVRTQTEIEVERYALKILRGDFDDTKAKDGPDKILAAIDR